MSATAAPVSALAKDQRIVNTIYSILDRFDKSASKIGLRYTMAAGTALGAVLRGGLIPWDTDADLFIPYNEFHHQLSDLRIEARKQDLVIKPFVFEGTVCDGWYKTHMITNPQITVDLFLLRASLFTGRWSVSCVGPAPLFPLRYLESYQLESIERVPFGPLSLPLFADPEKYFDRNYPRWRHVMKEADAWKRESTGFPDFRPALPTSDY